MKPIILRRNATTVYAFLSLIHSLNEGEGLAGKSILDCGAGGVLPPLSLFAPYAMKLFGLDLSEAQVEHGQAFFKEHGIEADLHQGDMRAMPFEDASFDYVYEQYSMCHLSHADTQKAVDEMWRVLKPGGLCMLGVISMDTWPKESFGEEREPGHFWGDEGGSLTIHSMFTVEMADALVAKWDVILKEKHVMYHTGEVEKCTLDEWMRLYGEVKESYTKEGWRDLFIERGKWFNYSHTYYFLRKK